MGTQTSKISAITLNYSGIYLSPFEYYGIDNWQELEKIGRIFEEELKKDYQQIRDRTNKMKSKEFDQKKKDQGERKRKQGGKSQQIAIKKDKDLPQDYMRKEFSWMAGEIDKEIHFERYTPIYTHESDIITRKFAGLTEIGQNECFMTESEFETKWNQMFTSLSEQKEIEIAEKKRTSPDQPSQINTAKVASELNKYHCWKFDFMCLKSIALYANHLVVHKDKILNFRETSCWGYEKLVNQSKENLKGSVIQRYKQIMAQYFSLIHVQTKIDLTVEWLFRKNSPELLYFTEGTPAFRERLEAVEGYHMFGPSQSNKTKQTIIMAKKTLPFIPKDTSSNQLSSGDDDIKKELLSKLEKYSQKLAAYWKDTLRQGKLSAKEKKNGDKWIKNLLDEKKEMREEKEMKEEDKKKGDKKEEEMGFLFWMKDITFHRYVNGNDKVVIGGFHLSSKKEIGQLQGQLLGLIIYYFVDQDYKFIFSGDFNSFIVLREKDQQLGVFSFIQSIKDCLKSQTIEKLTTNVRIYPKHPKILTTKKKRTMLQLQTRKANELAEKCIDQVITNYPIDYDQSHVGEIKDIGIAKNHYNSFLPHKDHPYDHFVVEAILDLKKSQ